MFLKHSIFSKHFKNVFKMFITNVFKKSEIKGFQKRPLLAGLCVQNHWFPFPLGRIPGYFIYNNNRVRIVRTSLFEQTSMNNVCVMCTNICVNKFPQGICYLHKQILNQSKYSILFSFDCITCDLNLSSNKTFFFLSAVNIRGTQRICFSKYMFLWNFRLASKKKEQIIRIFL